MINSIRSLSSIGHAWHDHQHRAESNRPCPLSRRPSPEKHCSCKAHRRIVGLQVTWDRLTTALVLGLNNLQRIPIHITLSALAVFSTFHAGLWSTNSADILFNSQLIKPSSLCSLLAISNTPLMHWMIKREILCGVWTSLMHSYSWQKILWTPCRWNRPLTKQMSEDPPDPGE